MRSVTATVIGLIVMTGLFFWIQAGSLDPPGPPGPTMHTLQEIYDLLQQVSEQQQVQIDSPALGYEPRLKGCLSVDTPFLPRDPSDAADQLCAEVPEPGTRLLEVSIVPGSGLPGTCS